jgi:hypothetical protein
MVGYRVIDGFREILKVTNRKKIGYRVMDGFRDGWLQSDAWIASEIQVANREFADYGELL